MDTNIQHTYPKEPIQNYADIWRQVWEAKDTIDGLIQKMHAASISADEIRIEAEKAIAANNQVLELLSIRKPKIVCLCGSTRFYKEFQQQNYLQTIAGNIVLSVGFYPHSQEQAHGQNIGITPEQKEALDELHKRKIDLADEIFVINVGGYIGYSTSSEIEYAKVTGKFIRFLE